MPSSFACSGICFSTSGVRTNPGQITFARTPCYFAAPDLRWVGGAEGVALPLLLDSIADPDPSGFLFEVLVPGGDPQGVLATLAEAFEPFAVRWVAVARGREDDDEGGTG